MTRDPDRAATATLALIFALIVGVSRRRTATVATIAWSAFLSRAIGARQRRNAETIARLFAERTSATTQIRHLKARVAGLEHEVRTGERSAFGADVVIVQHFAADDTGGGACA